jgi:predicted dehydrogenase
MSDKINWAVLGNATIARVCVIPAIQKSRNGRVIALASLNPGRSRELAVQWKIPRLYDRYETALQDPEIEAVYIPLPNHLHHPWTLRALGAGKHVLCEKPLACNAMEAAEMAVAASRCGRLLMEAFMYRFHPRSRRIRRMVREGALGKLRLIHSSFCFPMESRILDSGDDARLQRTGGGGALLDVGCYSVDLARWLYGAEPLRVQGQAVYHPNGVDLQFVGIMTFPEDGQATLEAGFISALKQTYSLAGTEGCLELPHDAFIPWEREAVFTFRLKDQERGETTNLPGIDEYRLMVEHFADSVKGACQIEIPPEDSLRNLLVLDALAEAARKGVALSPLKSPGPVR